MRNYLLAILLGVFVLYSCKKSGDGEPANGSSSSVSYKANGATVNVKGDYNTRPNAEGASFVYMAGTNLFQSHYRFTARASDGTLLGFSVISDPFKTGTFTSPVDPLGTGTTAGYGASLWMANKGYASGFNGDPTLTIQVVISKYEGGRADGTFKGKVARVVGTDNQGNINLEYATLDGSFNNVQVSK